jgi:hypothetical protein
MIIESLAKLPKSTRFAIAVIVVALPAAACYSWVVLPHTKYLSVTEQYGSVAFDIANKIRLIKSKIALKRRKLQELQESLAQTQEKFFTPQGAQKFFREIETVSHKAGCNIVSCEYVLKQKSERRPDKQNSAITSNNAIVAFVASYENVISFLANMLDRPEKVSIDSLEIAMMNYNSKALQCEATFTIFVLNDEEIFSND